MEKVLKVTREQEEDLFEYIGEFVVDSASNEHRKGSTFYNESIVEFKEEHKEFFIEQEDLEQLKDLTPYIGLWKTNSYVSSDQENGFEEIHTLTRVDKVEVQKTITTVVWQEIKD